MHQEWSAWTRDNDGLLLLTAYVDMNSTTQGVSNGAKRIHSKVYTLIFAEELLNVLPSLAQSLSERSFGLAALFQRRVHFFDKERLEKVSLKSGIVL